MRASKATELRVDAVGSRPGGPDVVVRAPVAEPRKSSERLANVERLRIVAMLEIVTFHVGESIGSGSQRLPVVAGLGLPVFLLLNNAFNCTLVERMGTRKFLDVKVSRLLLPWLIWSAVYAAIIIAESVRHDEPLAERFSLWTLVGGTYTHLWFVPFALFGSLLLAGLQVRTRALPHPLMAGLACVAGAALAVAGAWLIEARTIEWPVLQWLFALPSPLLGFALGRLLLSEDPGLRRRATVALSLLAAVVVGLGLAWQTPEVARRYAVSMALVSLFFLWPGKADAVSKRFTPLLFGIYLTHPLLVRVYQAAHLPALPTALGGLLVFGAAALFTEGLRRSPLQRLV
jgi:surface polysaccharide O-acyltransferase-like enzyme